MKFNSKAEKYIYSRDTYRKKHEHDFLSYDGETNNLVIHINELVASLTLFFSGKNLRKIENGLYYGDLVVSYCRSHFIISDLLVGGELVEAGTLIRKQMELLSRLNELSKGVEVEKLIKKTPNLKNLKSEIRRFYSDYSEIAHSASPEIMQLLGSKDIDDKTYTVLYPEFQENSFVVLQHHAGCSFEFYIWCVNFLTDNFQEYDDSTDTDLFKIAFDTQEKIFNKSTLHR